MVADGTAIASTSARFNVRTARCKAGTGDRPVPCRCDIRLGTASATSTTGTWSSSRSAGDSSITRW